jgi:hypothetical protein
VAGFGVGFWRRLLCGFDFGFVGGAGLGFGDGLFGLLGGFGAEGGLVPVAEGDGGGGSGDRRFLRLAVARVLPS